MIRRLLPAFLLLAAAPSLAQPQDMPRWTSRASGLVAATGKTDLQDGGSFSWSRWFVEGGVSRTMSPRRSHGATVGIGQSFYDFRSDGITGADLTLNEFQIAAPIRFELGAGGAFVIPSLSYAGEDGVSFDDGTTYGLLTGVAWRLGPSLVIGPGLGVFSSHNRDAEAFPFLILDWAITDRLKLGTGSLLAATRGPGLSLSYTVSDAWSLGVSARDEAFEFRMDDSGDYPGAVGIDRNLSVILTASYRPNPQISLTGFAGVLTEGELEFEDRDGDQLALDSYDPAPVFGLAFDIRF